MSPLTISRILFVCWIINEAVVAVRMPPSQRSKVQLPRLAPLAFGVLLVPLVWVLDYPVWAQWILMILQAAGLALELGGEFQLMRAKSFSVTAVKPDQVQQHGFYQLLENPIYVGIILQLLAWGLWMPLTLIGTGLMFEVMRRMVKNERAELAKIRFTHRGIDSFIWN